MKRFLSMVMALVLVLSCSLPVLASTVPQAPLAAETVPEETVLITEEPTSEAAAQDPEETEAQITEVPTETLIPETLPEKTAPEISEETTPAEIQITQWTWDDPDETLQENSLTLYGIGPDNPLSFSDVAAMLPQTILWEENAIPVTWECPNYTAGKDGDYMFMASLPQGYVLSPEAAPLQILVILPVTESDHTSSDSNSESSSVGAIRLLAATFPDPVFFAYLQNEVDTNKNGWLEDQERQGITTMDLSRKGIFTLHGISNFPNLQVLNCSYNKLKDLELKDNTALRELDCSVNELKKLDLHYNHKLVKALCSENKLEQIDVSGCPELYTLDVQCNCLPCLDLYRNEKLSNIFAYRNVYYCETEDGKLDLRTVPGFDLSKAKYWNGGAVDQNGILTMNPMATEVSYTYACSPLNTFSPQIVIGITSNTLAKIDEAHFPDAAFRQYILNNVDKNQNGILTSDESYSLHSMMLTDLGIQDLTGISYFPKLKYLELYNSPLKTVDLSKNTELDYLAFEGCSISKLDLSHNTKLQNLNLDETKLTELDISALTELTYFTCSPSSLKTITLGQKPKLVTLQLHNNQLSRLDLRGCTALTTLFSSYNHLTQVDLSACTELDDISIQENSLAELDLSHNTKLKRILLSDNQLKTIDFSHNPLVETIYCSSNPDLKQLNVSGCTQLKQLYCQFDSLEALDVSSCGLLQDLVCNWNQFTNLDVSHNPQLKKLVCGNAGLTEILPYAPSAGNRTRAAAVPGQDLTEFTCNGNRLTSLDLSACPNLQSLDCRDNALNSLIISPCPDLQTLLCTGNSLLYLDRSQNAKLTNCDYVEKANIFSTENGTLDLKKETILDPSRITNLQGGSIRNGILTSDTENGIISFDYAPEGEPIQHISLILKVPFDIYAANMTLGSTLSMHFYVRKADLDPDNFYYAMIERSYADGRPNDSVCILMTDWNDFNKDLYQFSYHDLAAKEMTDKLEIQIFGVGGKVASNKKIDSIQDYALRIIDQQPKMVQTMLADMLYYGGCAQKYFGYNPSHPAIEGLSPTHIQNMTPSVCIGNSRVEGPNYAGTTLKLESRLMMDLYFENVAEGHYAVVSYTDHTGAVHNKTVPYGSMRPNGKYRIVTVDDMAIADCRQLVTCKLYNSQGEEIGSVKDSPESYCTRMYYNPEGYLYDAIMKFCDSAHYYLHNR